MPTTASDFAQLVRSFERFNSQGSASRIFRDSLRSNNRLRRISRSSPLGRAGVNTASILGEALIGNLFGGDSFSAGGSGRSGGFSNGVTGISGGILGGANTASGLGDIFSGNGTQRSLLGVVSNLFEGLIGDALGVNRTRTSTTSRESDRSQEFSRLWNTSRSQQDAELASIVQRGLGQL